MEKIEVNVNRLGGIQSTQEAFSVSGLDRNLIRDHLLEQTQNYSVQEIMQGLSFGGIYVDPETGSWMNVLEHTDRASETIGETPSGDEINKYLFSKFTNVGHAFNGLENEPVDVTFI